MIAGEAFVNIKDQPRFCARFPFRLVDRVAFLPEKLRCPQKQTRPHFPADHVRPLIDQNWQVPIGLYPSRVAGADDRLRSGPDHQRLRQGTGRFHFSIRIHLQARVRDHRAFLGEAFDVFRFLGKIT